MTKDAATASKPVSDAPAPDVERDARALHRAVSHLVRVYQAMDRERICCHDVSVAQCWALEATCRDGPLTLGQVAARLLLDKSTASRVVEALDRKGYVVRGRNPDDARSLRIEATPEGRRHWARIEADILDRDARVLRDLSPEVRRTVVTVVDQLAGAACRCVPASDGSCCSPR